MKKVAELTISRGFNLKAYPKLTFDFFSRESDSTIANVCVCPSVCQSPKPLSLSESCLSAKSAHQP